jgi:eukaryotic-like serine/threonine-protein kinase
MGNPHEPEEPIPSSAGERHQELLRRFEAAWGETRTGGHRPAIQTFLQEISEPERSVLQAALEAIERRYRPRLDTDSLEDASATMEDGSATPAARDPDSLIKTLPYGSGDSAETGAVPQGMGATLEFAPDASAEGEGGDTSGESQPASRPQPHSKSPPVHVAGYEILKELGRGGMGVVYKARQKGLNRLVALKMVLAGAHAGEKQLARFHIEAEAVARLKHPNIVQIYEVGEHDGLPFFSLEYVDGGSLGDRIDDKPLPGRQAAELLSKLAHAMHEAHQHGIVHRDLKPANVLLTSDGVPKITDFGLAKRLEEGETGQTQSGTLMGTPSYMAPEQARGESRHSGPLADVYALGTILYEMLTGRPPFLAASILETLEQVRSQEPVPPSRLVPGVPRDLETVCLKCLQKEPAKRYPSARALGEDLDRFLAGEPIQARPVGGVERLWRWCKRNPRVAGLTAALFLLLVTGLIGSSAAAVTIARERNQKELERQAAEEARELAKKNADEAVEQGRLALRAFGTLIDEVQKQIGANPGLQDLKLKLLETALEGLDKVAKSDEDARLLGQSMAAAYMRMGQLYQQLGHTEKALAQFQKCHAIAQALLERDPDGDVARANLAASLLSLGGVCLELRDMTASLDHYQKALALHRDLSTRTLSDKLKPAQVRRDFAEAYTCVGVTYLRLGDAQRARPYFEEALKLREELAEADPKNPELQLLLVKSYNALAEVGFRSRDWSAARQFYAKSLAVCDRVYQEYPKNPNYKLELANTLGNFGVFDVRTGDLPAAREHCRRCLQLMEELAALDRRHALLQRYLGLANYRMATLAARLKDAETAQRCNGACLEIREKLAADDPKNERRRMELVLVLPRCGQHERAAAAAANFRDSKSVDREVLVEVAQVYAQCAAAVPHNPELRRRYTESALEALKQALTQGYKDLLILETEPDLDALRDQAGFQSLLARLRKG